MQQTSIDFTGLSGSIYSFMRFDRVPLFKTRLPCVYCIALPVPDTAGETCPSPVFVGQTDDFNADFPNGRHTLLLDAGGCVFILPMNDPGSRAGIQADMLMRLHQRDGRQVPLPLQPWVSAS